MGRRLDAAHELRDAGVDIVLVRRALPAAVAEAAARRCDHGPVLKLVYQLDMAALDDDVLSGVFRELGDGVLRTQLAADVGALASTWASLTGRRHARAVLSLVDQDRCRKLHCDYVDLRVLCTYAGPGTWLAAEHAIDRSALGTERDVRLANARVCPDPSRLSQADAGDIVFLKGRGWKHDARGAVHRSPEVEALGLRRLVLTIDGTGCGC